MPPSGQAGRPDLQVVPAAIARGGEGAAPPWAATVTGRREPGHGVRTSRRSNTLAAVHYDDGAVWVIELFGEADIGTRHTLEGALSAGLSKGRSAVVLDVSNLTFCDSACVDAVHEANADGCLVLAGATGTVSRVFEILDPLHTIARYRAPRPPFPS
jgi:anti-anti-sigma factor